MCSLFLCATVLVLLLSPLLTPAFASLTSSAHAPSPQDRAATHAYLLDIYGYEQQAVTNLPSSTASAKSMGASLSGECPGVLAGLPNSSQLEGPEGQPPRTTPGSARERGEDNRRGRQLNTLQDELIFSLSLAFSQPNRAAALTLMSALGSLSWSDSKFTQLARQAAGGRVQALSMPLPAVCADMRGWAASGYRTLSPGTKQLLSSVRAERGGFGELARLLVRYEGPSEKAIVRQTLQLEAAQAKSYKDTLEPLLETLPHTLGFPSNPFEGIAKRLHPRRSVLIARGRTAAGGSYTVSVEPPETGSSGEDRRCSVKIETSRGNGGIGFSFGAGQCRVSGNQPAPSVQCTEGLLTITANTLPRTRRVVLRLSNGRRIASRVAVIPKRLGGPGGLYYQVVRGPRPIPVSLIELDAHGRKLRTVALAHVVECTKPTLRYLPGGLRTLARDSVPAMGPAFSIIAQHYRFLGRTYFEVKLEVQPLPGEGEGFDFIEVGSEETIGNIFLHRGHKPSPLSWRYQPGCQPHPYAILYGVLKAPGATVLARRGGEVQAFHVVPIPASMHAGGVLVYAALPTLPEEILIRSRQGKTIYVEKLGATFGREHIETCEGEAEGG